MVPIPPDLSVLPALSRWTSLELGPLVGFGFATIAVVLGVVIAGLVAERRFAAALRHMGGADRTPKPAAPARPLRPAA